MELQRIILDLANFIRYDEVDIPAFEGPEEEESSTTASGASTQGSSFDD